MACATCCSMCCAGLLVARLAYADLRFRRDTTTAVAEAVRMDQFATPAAYLERLAELDPGHAEEWLARAVEVNPRLSSAWIARGLTAERAGDPGRAEHDLLQAAHMNHGYLPAWTLVNFYYRQSYYRQNPGDRSRSQFWIWARRAAEVTYDDSRTLLALARAVEAEPRVALEKLGGGERILHAELDDLATLKRFDDAQQVARLLMARRDPADAPRLLELAERQIRAGNGAYAVELWNAAATRFGPALTSELLNPEGGPVLSNGDLRRVPSGVAFDWRLPKTEGASAVWEPSRLVFSLSGDQPESCALLEQVVPVVRGRRYRLNFEYVTSGLTLPTGIVWALDGDEGSTLKPASEWLAAAATLRAEGLNLGKLRLLYRREPGTVRGSGRIELRRLQMEAL